MAHRRENARGPLQALILGVLVSLLLVSWIGAGLARESLTDREKERAKLLSEEEWARLIESGVPTDQIRGLLYEQGYSPEQVERILEAHQPPTGRPREAVTPERVPPLPDTARVQVREEFEEPEEVREPLVVRPFGYRLFSQGPSTFAPPPTIAVGPDYLLGPDDTVVINAWGPTELSYSLTISAEGDVVIPEIGLVYLASLSLREARNALRDLFEKFYPGIKLHVTVGQLRTQRVYVVGEVVQPGAYTVSSLSTVLTALYVAGGPTEDGSLRQIRLLRNNRVHRVLDLYRYLLEGERTNDVPLDSEDTILVPPVGDRVTLLGEVRRAAIYELVPREGLRDLIRMAGGVLPTGYLKRIQIDRIHENEQHIVLDVDYASLDSAAEPPEGALFDGDEVRVFQVLPEYANAVWIEGAIKRPGRYELKPGQTLLGLIESAEGLEGEAYLPRVEVERTEPNLQVRLLSPDLGAILRGEERDPTLIPKDRVRVYSIWDVRDQDRVEIYGEVRTPGAYVLTPNMTLEDLIFRAGGLRESAYLMRAEISRIRRAAEGSRLKSDAIPVPLTDVVSGKGEGNPQYLLQAGDKVFVRRIPQWDTLQTVTIRGEVRFPGTYALTSTSETLADLFERAGGVGGEAFLEAAVLEREPEGRVVVDFPKAILEKSKKENITLVGGDQVLVPKIPETVQVAGAVFRPSSLKFVPGKSADYYIHKCGGYLDRADRDKVRLTRTNGEVVAARSLWFDPEVERGNVIIVPFKEEKREIDWEKIAQIANVIAGLATTVYLLTEAYKH